MTTKAQVLKSIRTKCLDCCCGSRDEVARCHLQGCSLHPYRFGKDPSPSTSRNHRKPVLQKHGFERLEAKTDAL